MARENNRIDNPATLTDALRQRLENTQRDEVVDLSGLADRAATVAMPTITLAQNTAARSAARKNAPPATPQVAAEDDPSAASLLVKGRAKTTPPPAAAKTAVAVPDELPPPAAGVAALDTSLEEGLRVERIDEALGLAAPERDFAPPQDAPLLLPETLEDPNNFGVPTITVVFDNVEAGVGNVARGGATNDTLPTIRGTATPGSPVTVYDNGAVVGSTVADASGNWSLTPTAPLAAGPHQFTAVAANPDETPTAPSSPYPIVVDTAAPAAPSLDSVNDDVPLIVGVVPRAGVTNDARPEFKGLGEPGATITILDNGVPIGTAVADPVDGTWSFTPTTPLADGPHAVTIKATDPAGNESPVTTPAYPFTVDTVKPALPTLDTLEDDVAPVTGLIARGGSTNDDRPLVSGTGERGTTISVFDTKSPTPLTPIGTATVGADGKWSLTPATPLAEGPHEFSAVASDAAGNASDPTAPLPFTVDKTAPTGTTIDAIRDDIGPVTGNLAPGATTDDTRPTISGKGEPGATITVRDGPTELGSAVVQPDGTWTFTPTTPLADGPHSVTATATDPAGNAGVPAGPIPFIVDTTAPLPPAGLIATDDVGADVGVIPNNGITDDSKPTISGGPATPGDTITVFDKGVLIGTTTVKPDGTWSVDTPVLADGPHVLTAIATDPLGNASPPTPPLNFTVDTQGPDIGITLDANVAGDGIVNGAEAAAASIPIKGTVSGTFNPGDIVTVTVNGVDYRGPVAADGSFSIDVPGSGLASDPDRTINASVTTRDVAGNTASATDDVGYRLLADPPKATIKLDANFTGDGVVNLAESLRPAVAVTGTVGGDVKVGDPVTVTVNGKDFPTTVLAGNVFTVNVPGADLAADADRTIDAKVTTTDAAGNVANAATQLVYGVDTVPPAKPVISEVVDDVGAQTGPVPRNGATDDTVPQIKGTSEPLSTVTVFADGKPIGTTTTDPQGNWTLTPTSPLPNGPVNLTAVAADAAENPSVPSDPYPIVVDSNGPDAPAITVLNDDIGSVTGPIAKGGVTDDTKPEIVGTAGPNLKINLFENGQPIGSTTSDAKGDWRFTPTTDLTPGLHNITATAVSAAGVESAPTGVYPITVDTAAPPLTLDSANDDAGLAKGPILANSTTDDATPTLKGTGEPGAKVTVLDNGQPIGTTTVKPDGTWELTPTTPLADGPHRITATSTDPAGNTSPPTAPIPFTVDTSAVLDPVITKAIDDVAPQLGTVASGGATNDTRPTLEGTARAGDRVEVFYRDPITGTSTSLGTTVADPTGQWTLTPPANITLPQGSIDFTARATSPTGNLSNPSNTYNLLIDTAAPAAPTITTVTDDVGAKKGAVANNGPTDDTTPTIEGTGARPGDTIKVFDGPTPAGATPTLLGTTTVNPDGTWRFTPTTTLTDGRHEFTATEVDPAGNESGVSNPYAVVIDTTAPAKPVITLVEDDIGSITGPIDRDEITDDKQPKITGTAEPGATVEVFSNGKPIGTVTADPQGNWTLTPSTPLLDGPTSLTAIASDPAGNPSVPSDPYAFVVDGNGPVAPAITRVNDDVGSVTGTVVKNGVTDDSRPEILGTAGPNLTVRVFDNGVLLGTTTSNANGDWALTPANLLAPGLHNFTATAVSPAGVESTPTGVYAITIDITAPRLTLDTANDDVGASTGVITPGTRTDDSTPTLKGTGEPGAKVTVLDNGQPIGTVTVKPDGTWELTPTTPLADGPHNITATSTDAAGNTSAPQGPIPFTVDTSAVRDPVITKATDNFAPQTGDVANGGATNDKTPTLEGTARAGDRVEVFYKVPGGANVSIGSTTASPTGQWTLTPLTELGERSYDFVAVATSSTGNPSNPSNTYTLLIDATAPLAPAITEVTDDVGTKQGIVNPGATTDDTTPTIVGTGAPGDTIRVLDGAVQLGTTTVKPDGTWTFTPATTLADGPHTFRATAIDAAGNVSPQSAPYGVVIDTVAPLKPVISGVEDDVGAIIGNVPRDGTTDDAQPKITGTAEPGATVEVSDNGKPIGTAVADAQGNWSLTPVTPLLNGTNTLTAIATDAAGNPSVQSDPYAFKVDSNRPDAPAITRIVDDIGTVTGPIQKGAFIDDARPQIDGTAGPNLRINVYDGATLLGSTTSNAAGEWTFTPTTPLATGLHTITATAVSVAGVESAPTGEFPFTVDTTPPALSLTSANDDAGTAQGIIAPNSRTDDNTPTLKGTGEPGVTVTVLDNGRPIGTTTVKPDGSWELTPTTPLADGPHSITATGTDAAGNTSAPTAAIPFTVDTSAVVDPVITRAVDDVTPQTGTVASGGATNDTTPTLEGTARAGDTVVVTYVNAAGTTVTLGSATATPAGTWSLTPATGLPQGTYAFTAVATGPTGNPSQPSNTYGLVIDFTASPAPVITKAVDDVGSFKGDLASGARTDDTTPTVVGTGVPGDTIRVFDGAAILGTTTVRPDGSWSFTPTTTLTDGLHSFKAVAIDAAGNVSPDSNVFPVTVDTQAPGRPAITGVDDDIGTITGNVPRNGTTDDAQPRITGTAEPGATVEVSSNGRPIGTAVADANGNWALTPTTPLLNGPNSLTATATDVAGNTSPASDAYAVVLDTNRPEAPAITRVDDNVGPITDPVQKNGVTDDATPTIRGTAGANLTVRVFDGTTLIGTTTSNAQGIWELTPATPLANGPHTVTATAVSPAGIESAPTGPYPFTVDTVAPAIALVSANDDAGTVQGVIPSGGRTDDNTPTIRGTGEPGVTVTVLDGGRPIGTTTVGTDGAWAFTPTTALADGPHTITATGTDAAGNTSAPTTAIPFVIDTSAVVDPVITRAVDDIAPQTGTVPSGGATNDRNPTLEGTARAGDRVEVFFRVPGAANVSVGVTTADATGKWTLTPATALEQRAYDFVAVSTGPTGNLSNPSNTYSLLIDATPPSAPVITSVTDDVGAPQGPLASGARTDDTTPTIAGTGTPGDTIRVLDGTTVLGTAVVAPNGTWSFTPTTTLTDGPHTFRAIEVDRAGNESVPSNSFPVIVDTQAPARPVITFVTDDVGAVQGNVANGGTTDDAQPLLRGTAEAGSTVRVFDGTTPIGTATADAQGNWTLAVTTALIGAAHTFTATATDSAGNQSGLSDPYAITLDTSLVIVVNPGSATATSEEGLPGGLKDTTGTVDTTDATTAAGTLSASGPGGAATAWSLTAPTVPVTVGGVAVTWTGSGTQSLVGTAGGVQVATLSINNAGAYTFNLLAPIDHAGTNVEDVRTLDFGVRASNGTTSGTGTLALTVEDDAPSVAAPQTRDAALLDTNLIITLDISGSMNTGDGVNNTTRLQSAIQSINNLLDRYDAFGDVRVRLVTFSTNAAAIGTVWTDVASARSQLAALVAAGGTNYDEALGDTITAFDSTGKLAGAQNVAYFFSDGSPTYGSGTQQQLVAPGTNPSPTPNGTGNSQADPDTGIQAAEEALWLNFLNQNQIKAFAVGFGAGVQNNTFLNPIAYDGQQGTNSNGLAVTNFNQLDSVLAATVANNITGNLLGGDLITAGGGLGADAPGFVRSITIDGTTYTYDPAAGGSFVATGGANRGVFDTATDSLTVTTVAGGRFIVDMDGGDYRYESPTTVTAAIAETLNYVLTDRDGDTTGSAVTVNVSRVSTTLGTANNDTLTGSAAPDFIVGLAGDDTISGGDADDKLFGSAGNDTLNGGNGNDILSGGVGNDVLNGGAGADRLIGGPGNDTLNGGAGVDVFAWGFADNGTGAARAVDTIADFNAAPVSASGDVLDLRDLLIGELKGAATATSPNGVVGNLQNYLDFNVTGGNTEIRVSTAGQFANGTYAAASEDQRIVLQGVDIRSSLGLAGTANDSQIIQELLNRGKLITDGP